MKIKQNIKRTFYYCKCGSRILLKYTGIELGALWLLLIAIMLGQAIALSGAKK